MEEAWELAALVMTDAEAQKRKLCKELEVLGRVRLSDHFFMRDFLYSEISNAYGIPNNPVDKNLAIEAGTNLCRNLLEPLREKFGHLSIRSAYRSPDVNLSLIHI